MIRDLLHKIPMRYYVGAFFYGVSVNGLTSLFHSELTNTRPRT